MEGMKPKMKGGNKEKNERRKWRNVWNQSNPKGYSADKSGDSFSHIGL